MKKTALSMLAAEAVQSLHSSNRVFATPLSGMVFLTAQAPFFLRR
jgi:hypothetical protein